MRKILFLLVGLLAFCQAESQNREIEFEKSTLYCANGGASTPTKGKETSNNRNRKNSNTTVWKLRFLSAAISLVVFPNAISFRILLSAGVSRAFPFTFC